MNKNLLKLAKALLRLGQISTDKSELVYEGDLVEGIEVFVEGEDGELSPAEDGEYVTEDKIIVVADGKVAELKEREQEEEPEQLEGEDPTRIEELEAKVAELEAQLEAKDAEIAELKAQLDEKDTQLKESEEMSAKDRLKMNKDVKQPKGKKIEFLNFK